MIATSQLHRLAGLLVLFSALHAGGDRIEAQSSKTATKKTTTTVQVPKVDVTASEGSTAGAIRGRPANPAAVRTVNSALKTALAKPAVRAAVLAETRRQLRVNRPFALVDGHWVSAIDLATVYQAPTVRPALVAALGPNAAQLIAAAGGAREGIMIAFTPAQLGRLVMPDLARDIQASFGPDAFRNQMTDFTGLEVVVIVALSLVMIDFTVGMLELITDGISYYFDDTRPGADLDGDGIPNKDDKDRDGDGVPNGEDRYPDDKSKSICDCTRPAVFLGAGTQGDVLPGLISVLSSARAQRSRAVSLGPIVSGQAGSLALVF